MADCLDTSYFICLDRDPVYLAQSLLIASRFINGDENIPYGVDFNANRQPGDPHGLDAVDQVCSQVREYRRISFEQEKMIGSKRFIILPYEDFCADPARWVCHISDEILGQRLDSEILRQKLKPFNLSNNVKIEPEIFSRIKRAFKQKMDVK